MNKKIGYIGLGRMGFNMVNHLHEAGWGIVATDVSAEAVAKVNEAGMIGVENATGVVKQLGDAEPRVIWIMVPHQFVDDVIAEITQHLHEGDIVIDGGNSPFHKTLERGDALQKIGVEYIDAGVSGGPEGARTGACVMIGGDRLAYERVEELFKDVAAPDAYKYMGRRGAGHFVKMVHNGIEYGMMESIAEGFNIMRHSDFDLNMSDVADIYSHKSVITSSLISWLKDGFEKYGEDLEEVSGVAGASGEGAWTVKAAKRLGVEAHTIEHALDARVASQKNPSYHGKLIQTMRNMFGGHAGRTGVSE